MHQHVIQPPPCCDKDLHVQNISWVITCIHNIYISKDRVLRTQYRQGSKRDTERGYPLFLIQCRHGWRRDFVTTLKSQSTGVWMYEEITRMGLNRSRVELFGSSL
jgi:hypothetical protein